jgi:adenylate kinase
MMMKIIIFGPPGVGKGTYSSRIADKLDLVNISTGDMFREHMAQGIKLGRQIVGYMKKGQLVPDEIVIEMMKRRLTQPDCEKGFILVHLRRVPKNCTTGEGVRE